MKILIVGDTYYREKIISKAVKNNLTCQNNFLQLDDTETAKDTIHNFISENNKHIDLIIADDITEGNRHNNNLCDWIRFSDLSFSDLGNFRLSSIPIILCKREIRAEYQTNNHYNNVLPFIDDDKDLRIVDYSKKAVKSWREEILNDLETLKLDLNQLKIFGSQFMHLSPAYNKIARNYSHYFGVTKIVSENFIKTPNSLNYDWLSHDHLIKVERSYEGYNRIIKKLFKYNGKKIERQVLHAFYKKNKHFLLSKIAKITSANNHYLWITKANDCDTSIYG